jgi:hypothetical protein
MLFREEGVSSAHKAPRDPDYAAKKARVEYVTQSPTREVIPGPG